MNVHFIVDIITNTRACVRMWNIIYFWYRVMFNSWIRCNWGISFLSQSRNPFEGRWWVLKLESSWEALQCVIFVSYLIRTEGNRADRIFNYTFQVFSDRVGALQAWFTRIVYRRSLHKARKICWVKPDAFLSSRFTFCTRLSMAHVGGRYAGNVPL